jgi:hypothetical protein
MSVECCAEGKGEIIIAGHGHFEKEMPVSFLYTSRAGGKASFPGTLKFV